MGLDRGPLGSTRGVPHHQPNRRRSHLRVGRGQAADHRIYTSRLRCRTAPH